MSSISSLLNPAPEKSGDSHYREPIYDSPELSTLSATDDGDTGPSDTVDVPPSWTKKAEDPLPIGAPRGRLNFPPFEGQSDEIRRQVAAFHIQNYGNIRQQCKHIPYNSGKKDFQFKTGRDCLDGKKRRCKRLVAEWIVDDDDDNTRQSYNIGSG